MNFVLKIKVPLFLFFLVSAISLQAQFYNGTQMSFGKSRIQYNEFYWQYLRFEKCDVYFNEYGHDLALYTQWYADQEIKRLETLMDYTLEKRVIFLVFNKLTDFRQSNIGLVTGNESYNIGGVTRVLDNKIALFFEGDHIKYRSQISAAIAEVIFNEMLYGSQLRENMQNSAQLNIPFWFSKGLLSYIGQNWNTDIEDHVKDGILSGRYKKINRLEGDEAIYAGHSFWKYLEITYGKSIIPNIIYITRVNKNVKTGFLYVIGTSLKQLTREWYAYYSDRYKPYKSEITDPGSVVIKHPKKKRLYQSPKINAQGNYISFITNEMGQYRLWLHNTSNGRTKCLMKREHRIDQIPDNTFPVLAWHPNGKILSFITEEKGGLKLWFYNVENDEVNSRNLLYFEKVLDFAYSNEGSKVVMSAMKLSKTDIYVHTLASATDEQITNDLADDLNPRFINNSKGIIFSSNRLTDSISKDSSSMELSPFYELYAVPYPSKNASPVKISNGGYANHRQPFEVSSNKYMYLGDENGIYNRYLAEYDSVINYVDTTIHYRYFSKIGPLTDNPRNIIQHDFERKNKKVGQLFLKKNKYFIYNKDFNDTKGQKLTNTAYRNEFLKSIQKKIAADSVKKANLQKQLKAYQEKAAGFADTAKKEVPKTTSGEIDINHYVFEIERLRLYKATTTADIRKDNFNLNSSSSDTLEDKNNPKIRIYQPAFYTNFLVNQVDFSFLGQSYQPFNGKGGYYNPGFNLFFKLGTNDLFEDYKVIGGFRLGVDFDSNEYLLSFENLKKRIDKQIVFHRQAYKNMSVEGDDPFYVKTTTNEGYFVLKYPFSQVFSAQATSSLRYDRVAYLAIDNRVTLHKNSKYDVWGGLKLELIFDNSRRLGINLYSGTRFKAFGEAFRQVNRGKSDLFVVGTDYRKYTVIHRNLILANRFAYSSSFGGSRLIYYLGGVDNWMNFSSKTPTFDNSVRIDDQEKYAYQAIATNMRGFSQNVRNGNNFAVINNEIRFPFVTYFANYPVSSNFWSSLMAVGFFDVGSAWTGLTPFSGNNAYEYDIVSGEGSGVTVIVDSNRPPVVFGYGFGLRAQLLGYFMRFDWAWGVERRVILPQVFYFSMNLDF